jgi:hypothetical protein
VLAAVLEAHAARCESYLGLFLIGVIGWYCDRFGSLTGAEPRARHVDSAISRSA